MFSYERLVVQTLSMLYENNESFESTAQGTR